MKHTPKHTRTLEITFTALFAAIIAVLAVIPVPINFLGVPVTFQTFAVAFCGFALGWKLGLGSVGIYLFLGALGLPVFSNMQGGFAKLIGPTGGFLYGFLLLVFFCGLSVRVSRRGWRWAFGILLGTVGLLLCHLCGILQLAAVNHISVSAAFKGASLPFLPKDILSVLLAFSLSELVRKRLPFDLSLSSNRS
ncbi:MAG: biotin transporter BioY [Clostridia bacterium]|nr:biotin transporter BioY [Clostridia bacterium]